MSVLRWVGLGSDAAIESADGGYPNGPASKVAEAISIGRATRNIVRQNIVGSIGVKVIVLVAGASVLPRFGKLFLRM